MKTALQLVLSLASAAILLVARPAAASVINVSPASGTMAYTLIEGANPGDEVILAPGTYPFRVYLQQQATATNPIYIHSQDPTNPAIVDLSSAPGGLVDNAPGSYTAGDKARGCWQLSGATNIHIDGIVFQNCHAASNDSAGIRYYNGTTGFLLTNSLFKSNDNGLTGGTIGSDGVTQSEATVEWSEFSENGNLAASESSPTHNIYIYGGDFSLRYSYLHDPIQGQNLHCRAITSTIEYNWLSRAKSYTGDLMTNDDYANNPVGSLSQSMTFRGNVINQGTTQANDSQILALYNDEASGSPVSFHITMLYNTLYGAGGDAALVHLSDGDGTMMSAVLDDNLVYGTSVATLIDDASASTVSGSNNWLETGTATNGLTGSIFGTDPGFNNAASDDFVPLATSPCVGAANDTVAGLPVDEYYENEVVTRMYRVRASAKDIGAFEHDTSGPGIGPYGSADGGVVTGGDSGTSDSGSRDSGSGGHGSKDAGAVSGDGGAPTGDGGAGAPVKSSGCGCRLGGRAGDAGGGAWLVGLVGLASLFTRRRKEASARREKFWGRFF
jgi:MYXO-CTERM domain-containing protein